MVAVQPLGSADPCGVGRRSLHDERPSSLGRLGQRAATRSTAPRRIRPAARRLPGAGLWRAQGDVAVPKTEYDLDYAPDDPDVDPNKYPEQHLLQLSTDTTEHDGEALVLKDDPRYFAY